MKKRIMKLNLAKETLRNLGSDLIGVAGAVTAASACEPLSCGPVCFFETSAGADACLCVPSGRGC